jgi:hypothetical protein
VGAVGLNWNATFKYSLEIMRKALARRTKSLVVATAALVCCSASFATVVYDNSTTDLNRSYAAPNGVEFGDEVFLAGTDRTITDFRFETFLSATSGNETGQLTFRLNDGTAIGVGRNAPSTILYQSDVFSLGVGRQTVVASGISVKLPTGVSNFTWTLKLAGIDSGEQAGLLLYNPPTKGSSYDDFWQDNAGTWGTLLIDGGATPANFAARITAIPEPSTLALGLVGSISLLGYLVRRKQVA